MRAGLKWGAIAGVTALAMFLVLFAVVFGLRWFNAAADVAGPDNVRQQFAAVIEDWNALEASAQNACAAIDAARSAGSPMLLEDPAVAYAAQYRRIVVDFNRRQANIFEANVVGPSDYPTTAPSLEQMQERVCR